MSKTSKDSEVIYIEQGHDEQYIHGEEFWEELASTNPIFDEDVDRIAAYYKDRGYSSNPGDSRLPLSMLAALKRDRMLLELLVDETNNLLEVLEKLGITILHSDAGEAISAVMVATGVAMMTKQDDEKVRNAQIKENAALDRALKKRYIGKGTK